MTSRDWLRSRTARRIKAHGLVRGVFSIASGRDAQSFAVIPVLASPNPPARGTSPVPAPGATPPRREHFLGLDCE